MDPHEETDMASEPFISSHEAHATTEDNPNKIHATRIRRSTYIVLLVLFYAGLVLFSWIVICKLTYRPITANHYGVWIWNDQNNGWGRSHADVIQDEYHRNERWYKAARVIQSIVSVLTILLTSAVCSSAVVVYLQHCAGGGPTPNFTLRQMTVLADKGWTNIGTYFRLATGQWTRYSSSLLVWAVLLHILGAIISPLQQIFLSTETIKTPTYPMDVNFLLDIPDKFQEGESAQDATVVVARKSLASASGNDFPSQLWAGSDNCTALNELTEAKSMLCSQGGTSWGNLSLLSDPFLTQLPRDFNTGLVQQFLPRFNFTAHYENISATDFPTDCDTIPGALSIRQSNTPINMTYEVLSWAVHACMPTDLRMSPWKSTRARQDFTEELYLNVSLSADLQYEIRDGDYSSPFSEYFRITVDTTAGYFELPNYMNGQKAGPLLNDDPSAVCGNSCEPQGLTYPDIYNHHEPNAKKREEDNMPSIEDLELVRNKGPLLTTALALFGPNSWLDLVNRYPDLYQHRNITVTNYTEICIDLAPLGRIFDLNNLGSVNNAGLLFERNYINQCVFPVSPGGIKGWNTARSAGSWLYNFRAGTAAGQAGNAFLANAFTIAAYLANMAWISEGESVANSLTVTYDLGADSQKPSISLAGMIVVSLLIGLDLLGLLATAVYASWFPRWTGSLDAFSLLRLGGSISERVPLKVSVEDDEVRVLDELPGWVGNDARDENDAQGEKVGRIVLGGSGRFQTKMVYEAYDGKASRKRNQRW